MCACCPESHVFFMFFLFCDLCQNILCTLWFCNFNDRYVGPKVWKNVWIIFQLQEPYLCRRSWKKQQCLMFSTGHNQAPRVWQQGGTGLSRGMQMLCGTKKRVKLPGNRCHHSRRCLIKEMNTIQVLNIYYIFYTNRLNSKQITVTCFSLIVN